MIRTSWPRWKWPGFNGKATSHNKPQPQGRMIVAASCWSDYFNGQQGQGSRSESVKLGRIAKLRIILDENPLKVAKSETAAEAHFPERQWIWTGLELHRIDYILRMAQSKSRFKYNWQSGSPLNSTYWHAHMCNCVYSWVLAWGRVVPTSSIHLFQSADLHQEQQIVDKAPHDRCSRLSDAHD